MGKFKRFKLFPTVNILCFLLAAFALPSFGQVKTPFELSADLPVPEWVKRTDWQHPNVHSIDSLIAIYRATVEKETEQERPDLDDREEEHDFFEEPYLTAYIRWRREMSDFIQPDGTIKYDPDYKRRQLIQSIENQKQATDKNNAAKTTAPANWTVLGPVETYNRGTGTLKNEQSNIYCIAVAPSNPSVLYAGSETSTFYRSSDKGLHWTSVSESLTDAGSRSIAVDPYNENIVYTYNGSANTLMKTTTGGATWSVLSGFTGGGGNAIAVNRVSGRIYITGTTSVYYSDNAGTSWTMASGSTVSGSLYDLAINPTGNDTVYAVGKTSTNNLVLLRSVDGGANFADVSGSIPVTNTNGARFGVSPAASNVVYCINIGSTATPCLIKSTDRGATWAIPVTSTTTGLTGSSATTGLGMSNGQGYYDLSIVVSPLNANQVIVGTTTTYKSTDGGFNFSPVGGYSGPIGIHPDLQQAIAIGGDTYLATDGGVNYSSDFFSTTANWSVRNNGLRSADYWGFGQGWDEDIVVGGRYHNGDAAIFDVYGGGKAIALGGGEDATGHVYHGSSHTVGFRDIGNIILPVTLAGTVQSNAPNVPNTMWPQENYYGEFSSKLVVDPAYANTFYLGLDSFLWKSTNYGASYVALHNFGENNKVWRFDVARKNNSVIYLCATNGIYKSIDAGATWTTITLPVSWHYYNTDITTNPLNENEVYLCMASGATGEKVFRSMDGGASWTNITGAALNTKKVAFLQFHGGTNQGVYAITNKKPSQVFYRDGTMSDWVDFSAGLPASLIAAQGGLIFYRDSKMRLAGNCSILESPLYTVGAPVAQPMADKKYVGCARDTVSYFDYSMYDYAGASRVWAFPGALWVSSYTDIHPKVVYPGAGTYGVTLQVTNALSQTDIKTIDTMVIVTDDQCTPDTVAGKCLQMNGTAQTINLGTANINSNNFSISCWIQPQGRQSSFSQIVGHARYPGSANYGFGLGFKFNGYTPNLILCYTDSLVGYSNSSSLVCDSTRWNFVVLTYTPTGVILYLNGIADTVNSNPAMPVIDLSQAPFQINLDVHNGQGSKYKGKIEEVKFYNYALSQTEVREKMHLITDPATESGLIKYYQFNQYDLTSGSLYDVKGNFNTFVPAANIVPSTAPVSTGHVYRNTAVSVAGLNDFPAANLSLFLPPAATYPDGEVVAFHLFSNPDTRPDSRALVPGYFIVNNYGANAQFTAPDSVLFKGLNIAYPTNTAGDFKLFSRATGDFGNTWTAELDSATGYSYAPFNSTLRWTGNAHDTVFNRQFVVVNNDTSFVPLTTVPEKDVWSVSDLYPNPGKSWCKLNINVPSGPGGLVTISISDIKGAGIVRFSERLHIGENTILMQLPKLAPGSYLVNIEMPGLRYQTRKLVVD